jgi:glycosyltransferase involved in cell wall biosynthesis
VRVLIDFRAALRERSGVGEYAHQLVRALLEQPSSSAANGRLDLSLFSSSWKDRLRLPPEMAGARAIDRRLPVGVLNFAWHRLQWPPAETLTQQEFDITHSLHPLMMPARHAAQVITIHDLHFLANPERTHSEIRRDYPALVHDHARRADRVIVISQFTANEVERQLGVSSDHISVVRPGAPEWQPRPAAPANGYVLFLGTLEARKNVEGLLNAYEHLVRAGKNVPELVIAGKATATAKRWLERIAGAPLAGHVRHIGYVQPADRLALYDGARLLVLPSFDEGFGMPVLEAMTRGVPVVAANRGALPEVLGDAGPLVDPDDCEAIAGAIQRLIEDERLAAACTAKGVLRSRQFTWALSAQHALEAYRQAIDAHRH